MFFTQRTSMHLSLGLSNIVRFKCGVADSPLSDVDCMLVSMRASSSLEACTSKGSSINQTVLGR
jgi:hypothetical protein